MTRVNRAAVAVVTALLLGAAPASAVADSAKDTAAEIAQAVVAEPTAAPATDLAAIDLPASGTGDVRAAGLALGLPATGTAQIIGDTAIYRSDESSQAQVAVQAVDGGVRALVNIDSAAAPERYDFALGGNVASLVPQPDGSVVTLDLGFNQTGTIAAPWARDANGKSVPTRYEINGTMLTQVVDHVGGKYDYGITADPFWVPVAVMIARCMANRACRAALQRAPGAINRLYELFF